MVPAWLRTLSTPMLRRAICTRSQGSLSSCSPLSEVLAKRKGSVLVEPRSNSQETVSVRRAASLQTMRSDRKVPFSTGTGASTKVVSDNLDDVQKDGGGNKEYDDAGTPDAGADEAEGSESATRFRSLISEFRTVKKEVVVEVSMKLTWARDTDESASSAQTQAVHLCHSARDDAWSLRT